MNIMRSRILSLSILIIIITTFHIWGRNLVPFHPDESTYLYMSSDFEKLIQDPLSLVWQKDQEANDKQRYRELDAPITRYVLGLGRTIIGLPALSVDWDWSKTWEENHQAGAIPDSQLLSISRLTLTLLLPFSLIFIYLTAHKIAGWVAGFSAVIFVGLNALVLLHTRRAMAEGALLFSISFYIWSLSIGVRNPWITGLATALAFNSKHSAIILFPIGILAVCLFSKDSKISSFRIGKNLGIYFATFLLVTLALNPFLWSDPLRAAASSWQSRQELLELQVADVSNIASNQILISPSQRLAAMFAHLYLTPPSFAEIGNYRDNTAHSENSYLSTYGHNIGRGYIAGITLSILSIFGFISGGLNIFRQNSAQKPLLLLLLLASIAQGLFLLFVLPLPWQRYYIPLIPFVSIWIAYGIDTMLKTLTEYLKNLNKDP